MTDFYHFCETIDAHTRAINSLKSSFDSINYLCTSIIDTLQNSGRLLLIGNGGSASDAQHIAAELVCKFKAERLGLPAIALTTDSSVITAISNDYGYSQVFSRQIEALASPQDFLLALSTSGESPNILSGMLTASSVGCKTGLLTGKTGGSALNHAHVSVQVDSTETSIIQECHIFIAHYLCDRVDEYFS